MTVNLFEERVAAPSALGVARESGLFYSGYHGLGLDGPHDAHRA
ncbi:hypothetical protein QNO09_28080 [Streptomyces sp. 378]|nr:hypothetical protein [Streptomyces sp. 378]MDK1347093.1 hypothetical protein [Streptomyces sp. 378]